MQKLYIILLFVLCAKLIYAQDNRLQEVFQPLIGHTWIADTVLQDQSTFRQHCTFKFDLENQLVIVSSNGFIDRAQTQWGQRNHGIRYIDPKTKQLSFVEYDAFGGRTQGRIFVEGDNLFYTYAYGREILTDAWIKKSATHYHFKVGVRKEGNWEKVYIECDFKAKAIASDPQYHALDFWLGSWDVIDNAKDEIVGHSQVNSILDGMALQEESHSADGNFYGIGISKYNPSTTKWDQMWVDNAGNTFMLKASIDKGKIVFTNEYQKEGIHYQRKVIWTKEADGSISQLWQISELGKEDWQTEYDLVYKKRK